MTTIINTTVNTISNTLTASEDTTMTTFAALDLNTKSVLVDAAAHALSIGVSIERLAGGEFQEYILDLDKNSNDQFVLAPEFKMDIAVQFSKLNDAQRLAMVKAASTFYEDQLNAIFDDDKDSLYTFNDFSAEAKKFIFSVVAEAGMWEVEAEELAARYEVFFNDYVANNKDEFSKEITEGVMNILKVITEKNRAVIFADAKDYDPLEVLLASL